MKKILALILVLSVFAVLAACTHVTRIYIENSAQIRLEIAGSSESITMTDAKTVHHLTDMISQIPLQAAEKSNGPWTHKLTWLDEDGRETATVFLAENQIRWQGKSYNLGIGMNLSVITDMLESIPEMEK